MAELSACPICNLTVLSHELERHANSHFDDEDIDIDFQLAQQISLVPSTPPFIIPVDDVMQCETSSRKNQESSSSKFEAKNCSPGVNGVTEKPGILSSVKINETHPQIGQGLMDLLRNCLELETEKTTTILCDFVDHFQSIPSEDFGWGCGWRNIQMLSSHLLKQRQEARAVLYAGSGFVPDILSLQRWLEIAWERGFDKQGSEDFDKAIYGKRNWIGTTECATLFRSFGLRARIVDFVSREIGIRASGVGKCVGKMAPQVYGPMDKYLSKKKNDVSEAVSTSYDVKVKPKVQQALIDWVWNYFSDNKFTKSGNHGIRVSQKAPLYFQHDGHSRTIVGIQIKCQSNGAMQYTLLILDPSHTTESLAKSLKGNFGWQKLIKRGVHTLKKPLYQLCFLDPGIASGEEIENLKYLHSVRVEV
ncbi:zinc finger-containing ubiquitin peptidase 1 isoform X1 [Capsicum annuum]|nr:zinc finger-containing ubiquitin peptidase 1 isoform X1 [Capsicum annuum]